MRQGLMSRLLLVVMLLVPVSALAQLRFQEGRHYVTVPTPQATGLAPAGKIEVIEVFSYACSACYQTQPIAEELAKALPADAVMTYVHGALGHPDWRALQRGHVAAQQLGIADRNHKRMFTAIWETGEYPHFDRATGRLRKPEAGVPELARFYAKGGGVTEAAFTSKANSKDVDAAVQRIETLIRGWQVGGTPTFLVAGRYRIVSDGVSSAQEMKSLVSYLVGLERNRLRAAAAKKD